MNARLNRLFAHDGRCVNVAVDHGLFNEASFLDGIRDMSRLVAALVDAGPDAIQLTVGQAHLLQERAGPKPALVLRTDVANVYGRSLPGVLFSEIGPKAVEQAVALDAACVVVNLLLLPDRSDVHHACVRNVVRLKAACESVEMPLMVEPLVMRPNHEAGGYQVDGDTEKIAALVRQAVELGADVIKADPTDDTDDYVEIVRIAGSCPVLVRGGGRAEPEVVLRRVQAFLDQGAAGIVFGRNVFQHDEPGRIAQVLTDLVHGRVAVGAAIAQMRVPSAAGG